jgi:hypothetical protein
MQTIARSVGSSLSAASSAAIVSRFTAGSFVCPAASVVFWWQKTNVSPVSRRCRASSTRPRRSPTGSSVSGASTGSSPSAVPSPRRKAESAAKAPVTPCRSRKLGTARGRPNHFSVITSKRSPSSRRSTSRVHSSQARAVPSASGTSAWGRSSGCHARKKASVSVTRSSAPPEMRSTASPRQTCASENVRPSTSIPSQRSTSRSASSASPSGSGRPVSHQPSGRRSAVRSAAYANTCSPLTSCPRPSASKTARPGNSSGR